MQDLSDSSATWETARSYALLIGPIPQAFQGCIRSLRQNQAQNIAENHVGVDESSDFQLGRLLNSKTIKAAFYYAMLTYYEDNAKKRYINPREIVAPFSPGALASLLTIIYLTRFCRRIVTEGWDALARRIQESSDIGGIVGRTIPALGFDASLLIGPIRHIAFATVLQRYPKSYLECKRYLRKNGKPFDYNWEIKQFGCTLGQIASIILQAAGFGVNFSKAYFEATSSGFTLPLEDKANALRLLAVWTESMLVGCPIPRVEGEDNFTMEEEQMKSLISNAELIRENGSRFSWLNKTRDDISPERTPALYSEKEHEAAVSQCARDDLDDIFG